jgi:hypothetical protein
MKIAVLADLSEALTTASSNPVVLTGIEVIEALTASAAERNDLSIDVVARRGSQIKHPLISIDPEELGSWPSDETSRQQYRDAIYTQLTLSGLLDGYDLIHCITPLSSSLQVIKAGGVPMVMTLAWPKLPGIPELPMRLLGQGLAVVSIGSSEINAPEECDTIHMSLDLDTYRPATNSSYRSLLWMGTGGKWGRKRAIEVADELGLVFTDGSTSPMPVAMQEAKCLLLPGSKLTAIDDIWATRALACGTTIAVTQGQQIQNLPKELILQIPDWEETTAAAAVINACDSSQSAVDSRRQWALAYRSRSVMAGKYRRLYDRGITSRSKHAVD